VKKNKEGEGNGGEQEILTRLSERVEKAVSVIQELRRENTALKARVDAAEAKVKDHDEASERLTSLEEECERFRRERDEVRMRIEKILTNIESLDE
jgi:FtsZ-binding cell division protein ZapB